MAASSGLRQGCSTACTLCPSKAAQSVQSLPQLGIIVFVRRKRRAQFYCPSPRTPTALCNRQPRAPTGGAVSFLPSATIPSCAAFLGGECTSFSHAHVPPVPAKADPGSADLRPAQPQPLGTPPPGKFREKNSQPPAAAEPLLLWISMVRRRLSRTVFGRLGGAKMLRKLLKISLLMSILFRIL